MPAPGVVWGTDTWHVDAWAANTWGTAVAVAVVAGSAPLHALDILDKPTCAGGKVVARVTDCFRRTAVFTTTGEDEFTVEAPLSSLAAVHLTSRNVARVQFADHPDNFLEWRFADDEVRVRRKGGRIIATAYDLVNDLAAPGPIRTLDPNTGIPNFRFSVEATALELLTTYILPRAAEKGYTWIAAGEVGPTEKRLWEWDRLNPLELLRLICSVTRHEYRLRRNGTTNYLIDIVETINGDVPAIELRPGINLTDFRRTRKGASHFTALEGFGITAQDGQRATAARALYKVTLVTTGTNRLKLEDPSGVGAGPIIEDDQYVHSGPAPGFLFRYNRGGIHRIVDSFVATQEVQLDSVAGYAVGDLVELRGSVGATTLASEIPDGWTTPSSLQWSGKRVTNVDAGNKRLTVDVPFLSSQDPVGLDGRYRGWIVHPYFRSASSQVSNNVTASNPDHRQFTVASTTGMLAGDLCYYTQVNPTGAPPWAFQYAVALEVVSVDSSTLVTVKHRRKAGAVPAVANNLFLSTWRARTPDRVCTDCDESSNTIDLDSVTSIANDDLVEVVRRYDGAVQTELASPAGVAAHGVRVGSFDRETRGEANLFAPFNAYFRNWANGPNAPADSWYHGIDGKAFGVKNTNAAFLRTGANSVRIMAIGRCTFSSGISAGATSALLAPTSGSRFEVGESVILSFGLGNAETVILTSVSADGLTIGFAACANGHLSTEEVRSVALATDALRLGATVGTFGTLLSELLDCPSVPSTLQSFGVRVLVYLKGLVNGDQVPIKFSITNHAELGGSTVTTTVTLNPATGAIPDSINEVWIPLTQPIPGGMMRLEVGYTPTSNSYPSDKAVFVCAVGLFQTSYDPEALPEFAFATELHQATNAKLALVSQAAPASYDFGVVDLYGLDPNTWPYLQLIPGAIARTTEPAAGVAGLPLRILKLTVPFNTPAKSRAEVGTKQQRLTEILANAKVAVPVVQVNPDGSAQVLPQAAHQQLSFPTIGLTPPPISGGFKVVEA